VWALVAEAVDPSAIAEARLDSATVRSSIVRRAKAYPKVELVRGPRRAACTLPRVCRDRARIGSRLSDEGLLSHAFRTEVKPLARCTSQHKPEVQRIISRIIKTGPRGVSSVGFEYLINECSTDAAV